MEEINIDNINTTLANITLANLSKIHDDLCDENYDEYDMKIAKTIFIYMLYNDDTLSKDKKVVILNNYENKKDSFKEIFCELVDDYGCDFCDNVKSWKKMRKRGYNNIVKKITGEQQQIQLPFVIKEEFIELQGKFDGLTKQNVELQEENKELKNIINGLIEKYNKEHQEYKNKQQQIQYVEKKEFEELLKKVDDLQMQSSKLQEENDELKKQFQKSIKQNTEIFQEIKEDVVLLQEENQNYGKQIISIKKITNTMSQQLQ